MAIEYPASHAGCVFAFVWDRPPLEVPHVLCAAPIITREHKAVNAAIAARDLPVKMGRVFLLS